MTAASRYDLSCPDENTWILAPGNSRFRHQTMVVGLAEHMHPEENDP